MVKVPIFKGSCTAIITPFNDVGVDYEKLKRNIEYQYENGTSAILVCGTTGENATLSTEEHDELVRVAVRETNGRMKVIAGIGSNNTKNALRSAENAKYAGADGVLMVSPYYNKTSQKGLAEHFTYVANGIKEASGDISYASKIRSACGDDLHIWSGNDDCTVALMSLGALGVISVASNVSPGAVAKLCELCLDDNYKEASELFCRYSQLFSALFIETNPIPVKTAMKFMGMDSGIMRLPLTELAQENVGKLTSAMRAAGINI